MVLSEYVYMLNPVDATSYPPRLQTCRMAYRLMPIQHCHRPRKTAVFLGYSWSQGESYEVINYYNSNTQEDSLPLPINFGCVSMSAQVSYMNKVVQILYFKSKNDGLVTEVHLEHFIKHQVNNSTLKNLPDFLVCNKVILLTCCPFCMGSKEVWEYTFWEGREPSCFARCYVFSG